MRLKQGCSGIWIAAAAAAIDQISKSAIRRIYENRPSLWLTGSGRLWEWQGLFAIRATSNTGVAFSMLSSSGIALILFTALIIAALTGWLIAKPNALPKTARAGMWMIIGGGLGNLYDRIVYGAVMDFIYCWTRWKRTVPACPTTS